MNREKIFIFIFIILISFVSILCIFKQNHTKKVQKSEKNNFQNISFYKKEYKKRYLLYQQKNPKMTHKKIVLEVNIGLDQPFYTNTKEVKDFHILMIVNKYNYLKNEINKDKLVPVLEFSKENMFLQKECMEAFIHMARDALASGYHLRVISAYRSFDYQEKLYQNYIKIDGIKLADTYSARPRFSEHHTGLAIDLDNKKLNYNQFENTKEFSWMQENSYKYGFILRYPKDTYTTGYQYEPWHYRYVGIEVATYIKRHNITFEEYYYEFIDQ